MRYTLILALPVLVLGFVGPPPTAILPAAVEGAAGAGPAVAPGQEMTVAQRQVLFAGADFGRLWRHKPMGSTEDVLNGYYGSDFQRLEFVFTSVQADAKTPGRYLVAGKFRCYGEVTPFRGSVALQQVQRLANDAKVYRNGREAAEPTYCATGRFALQSTTRRGLGGQFSGRVALDFQLTPEQRPELASNTDNLGTRWGGLLFDGNWRETAGAEPVPVLWKQGMAVTRQVLSRFEIGNRDIEINPRYARVGWDSYWKNDEWWAERKVAKR